MSKDGEFDVNAFARLTRTAQIALCLQQAEQAKMLAENAAPAHRTAYLEIVNQWLSLAQDMRESESRKSEPGSRWKAEFRNGN